jgi:hypothetical protein
MCVPKQEFGNEGTLHRPTAIPEWFFVTTRRRPGTIALSPACTPGRIAMSPHLALLGSIGRALLGGAVKLLTSGLPVAPYSWS